MYQIFISYRKETGSVEAQLVAVKLKSEGYHVFLDTDNIHSGKFPEQIINALDEVSDVILIMTPNYLDRCINTDDWVKKEIEIALNRKCKIHPLIFDKFEFPKVIPNAIQQIQELQQTRIYMEYFNQIFRDFSNINLPDKTVSLEEKSGSSLVKEEIKDKRTENKYNTTRFKAVERLSTQNTLLREYNDIIYNKLIEDKKQYSVLDIGCNDGENILTSALNSDECKIIIGVEISNKVYEKAANKSSPLTAYKLDCESKSFKSDLSKICQIHEVEYFEIINLSFVLLHFKKPFKLLKILLKFLSPCGTIYIRDVDDGLILSHPDPNNLVKTIKQIDGTLENTGFRKTGREIYKWLSNLGYSQIKSIPEIIDTIGKDKKTRLAMFDMNFSYIHENIHDMLLKYPNNQQFKNNLQWHDDNYDDIEELFYDSNYYFRLGLVVFTAKANKN